MGKSQPKAPDPAKTAAAQGEWNSFTAQQQQAMNMTGQNSPWGSLAYNQSGTQTIIDPNGKPVEVPMYTANTTLSAPQQAIYDQTQAADLNLAKTANEQSGRIGNLLNDPFSFEGGKPFSFSNQDASNWAYDLAQERIAPQQEQARKQLDTQLLNRGIRPGSPAYDQEMQRLTNANTDQNNQLALTGRNQAFNEQLTGRSTNFNEQLATRNQPLNEIIGLMSGTQVENPNSTFAQTPQSQVAGVDYTGLVNQKYQGEMQQYNAQTGALGGLFGGLAGMFKFSDRRLKKHIRLIGERYGLPWYSFRYIWDNEEHEGFMSDDVRKVRPDAVMVENGFDKVNYSALGAA